MRILLILLAVLITGIRGDKPTFCDRIHPEKLPEECTCSEPGHLGLLIECLKVFNNTYFNDTIGVKLDIEPCNPEGSSISVDVTELNHNIDYEVSGIRAGEEQIYPIPGLAIMVPGIGHLGLDVDVLISGNVDQLTIKVGLNACMAVGDHMVCANAIPGVNQFLPWWILEDTYSFGDICDARMIAAIS